MPRQTIPVRIDIEVRDDISYMRRELSVKYARDFSISDVIRSLIQGYSGNPRLAEILREIIDNRPDRLFPENNPKPGV